MCAGPVTAGLLTKRLSSVASSTTSTSARWMVWLQNDSSRESGGQKPTLDLTHCRSRSISEIYAPLTPKISTARRVMASKYSDVALSRMPSFSSAATRLRSSSGSIHSVIWVSMAPLRALCRQQLAQRRGGASEGLAVTGALGLEDADGVVQVAGLVLQDLHRRGGLLDQRRVLLRDLVHQGDGAVDFLDADALLWLAVLMALTMPVTCCTLATMSRMVAPAVWTSSVPTSTLLTDSSISALTSRAAVELRWARLRTSVATTAKPRPCSP